jgi:hypothetical protein
VSQEAAANKLVKHFEIGIYAFNYFLDSASMLIVGVLLTEYGLSSHSMEGCIDQSRFSA